MRKNNKKMKKQEGILLNKRGITLIALVVTIVVLLILAGITISTLFGENGIINAARRAEQDTANAENTTNQGLKNLEGQMADAMDSSGLKSLIDSKDFATSNKEITDRTGKKMVVPAGFKIADDSSNEIDKGVVIEDKIGNQYVWVPVSGSFSDPNSELSAMFGSTTSGTTTNYFGKLYNFTTTGKGSPMQSTIGSTSGRKEPDILTDTTYGDASTGTANASYNGIDKLKNVVGIAADSDATDENQSILDNWQNKLQKDFNEMVKSVEHYHGFYIGRYEASSLNSANPKTVKGADPNVSQNMSDINWYNMYKNMQGVEKYANSGVQTDVVTNMIWGCQWDRTLDWIATTDTKIGYAGLKNSTSWGNHKDATFEYKATSGATTTTIKAKNSSTKVPTGSTEYTKANNIYDLAGNLYEWTMEANFTDGRTIRGGYCSFSGSDRPASGRNVNSPHTSTDIGSRPTLYVTLPAGSNP